MRDTKRFLHQRGVKLNNKQIAEIYMAIGGIPHYLLQVEPGKTATQIIEKLAFTKGAFLLTEFVKLFESLFDDADIYIDIIRAIAKHRNGISQEEIFKSVKGLSKGGGAKKKLDALEEAGFILSFIPYTHKEKGTYYKLIDEYIIFYFDWVEPIRKKLQRRALKPRHWNEVKNTPAWHAWSGYAFEALCYKHLIQISNALELSPSAIADSWRYIPKKGTSEKGAQIDLLFHRNDGAITVCEIKYTTDPFVIDKSYAHKLQNKIDVFVERTKTNKQIFVAMISANGIKKTMYSEEMVSAVVKLDDLFKSE